LESKGQESSAFGVIEKEENLGDDGKLVMVVAMGYFPASTASLQWPRLLILAPP
jgi:hypothetical protein